MAIRWQQRTGHIARHQQLLGEQILPRHRDARRRAAPRRLSLRLSSLHNRSFVMGVGVRPKDVAYGNNRSDFTFIAGGVVPGMLLLQPDYIENKDDWPFFWGQNECTIGQNAMYLYYGNILSGM